MTGGDSVQFVGRSAERAALGQLVEGVRAGRGATVLVEGEAGIGKSSLVAEVVADARSRGVHVVHAHAQPLERELPFAVIASVLALRPDAPDPDRAALGSWLRGEVPAGTDPGQARYRIVEGILDLVERLGQQAPLLLVVDDLHWADNPSLLVIDRLARRIRHLPLGLFATVRPYPHPPPLDTFTATIVSVGGMRMPLAPLGEDDVCALMTGLLGRQPDPDLVTAVSGAGGNPLFVIELLAALGGGGALDRSGGNHAGHVPSSLRATCRRRLDPLPEDTRKVLRVAAVLGSTFDVASLATVTRRAAADLIADLDPALREGIVVESGERLKFRHEVVRDAVYGELPAAARRGLHADAARTLGEAGYPARQLATHLLRSAPPGDDRAVSWLRQAAGEAIGAPDVAVQLLERAVELADQGHPERDPVRIELARLLVWCGRPRDAESLALTLLAEGAKPLAERAVRNILVQALIAQGRLEDALAELRLATHEPDVSDSERARFLAELARAWAHTGEWPEGARVAEEALTLGERVGDHYTVCLASTALAAASFFTGFAERSIQYGERALSIAWGSDDPELARADPGFVLSIFLAFADRHERARHVAEEGASRAERAGVTWGLPAYHGALGVSSFRLGQWEPAAAQLETAVNLAEEVGYRFGLVHHLWFLTRLAVHRGDLGAAERWAAAAARERSETQTGHTGFPDHARALVLHAQGHTHHALSLLQEARRRYAAGWQMFNLELGPLLVGLATRAGQSEIAAEASAEVDQLAERWSTPWARGQALRCRALVGADPDQARSATEVLAAGAPPYELAGACEETAGLLIQRGACGREAVQFLERAAAIWEGLGARRDAARVAASLRDLGVGRGVRGLRDRPETGWAALTETEWRVAELVADGLVYRDIGGRMFISRRTVETHVAHIFAKLEVSSRAEFAAAYARRAG